MRRLLLLLGLVALLRADVPLRVYRGVPADWHNARNLAGTGLAGFGPDAGAVLARPGILGFADRPGFELSYGLKWTSEQRTRTVYDQFENAIGEVTVADNVGIVPVTGSAAGVMPLFGRFAVGLGVAPVLDFGYRYDKEHRDDFYVRIGEDRVEQNGMLYAGKLGIGVRVLDWLSVGANGAYLTGTRELDLWTIRGSDTTHESESGSPSGLAFAGGFGLKPLSGLMLDVEFESGTKLNDWASADSVLPAGERSLPWSGKLALAYYAPGILPAGITAEVSYHCWDDVDTTASNVIVAALGVEHTMLDFVKLRYGVGIEPMPFDPTVQLVRVGVGAGFDVGAALVDVGMMFCRDAIGPGHFRTRLDPDDQKVYETSGVFGITVRREF